MKITERMAVLIHAVRDYATQRYNQDGWDFVSETFEDADIADLLVETMTTEEAVYAVEAVTRELDERRRDELGEIF